MNTTREQLQEEHLLKEQYEEMFNELLNQLHDPMNIESNYQIFSRKQFNEMLKLWKKELLGMDLYH